jgi:hypothetical protein
MPSHGTPPVRMQHCRAWQRCLIRGSRDTSLVEFTFGHYTHFRWDRKRGFLRDCRPQFESEPKSQPLFRARSPDMGFALNAQHFSLRAFWAKHACVTPTKGWLPLAAIMALLLAADDSPSMRLAPLRKCRECAGRARHRRVQFRRPLGLFVGNHPVIRARVVMALHGRQLADNV